MNNSATYMKKRILIVWALLSLICVVYGQYTPPPQTGDYRNTQNDAVVNNATNWEEYDGTGWVAATNPLTYYQPAFTGNIYADYNMAVNADFTMGGNIYSPNAGTSINVSEGKTFTLSSGCTYQFRKMTVSKLAKFINYGTVESKQADSRMVLDEATTMGDGGLLENHGSIQIQGELYLKNYSKMISKKGATVWGTGKLTTSINGCRFIIANTDGFDGAIALTGTHSVTRACFTYNGDEPQETGENLPIRIFSIDIEGGQTVTLSRQINMSGDSDPVRGDPYVRVHGGSTLDTKGYYIYPYTTYGTCTFYLEPEATIVTAHEDGLSSNIVNGYIRTGAIRTNNAVYSSGANYTFNGTGPGGRQNSGYFKTSPKLKTVNNIINESQSMLKLHSDYSPLKVEGGYLGNINTDSSITTEGYVDGQTLPVTLSYFNAFFNGFDSVILQWETQSETNNLGFYVLRSVEPDAALANVVSDLVPAANSSQGAIYYFEDADLYEDGVYYYWLQDVSFTGEIELHGPTMAQVTLQGGSNHVPDLPLKTGLIRNYPNPFNPSTQLEYYLENSSDVCFEVYNLRGQMVEQFTLRNQANGFHRYKWKPQLSSGTYLIKFSADGKSNIRKVLLAK